MINNCVSNSLAIGIEIGGTKLQVGIGSASGKLLKPPMRRQVIRENGAEGILRDLVVMVDELLVSTENRIEDIDRIGIGFGGRFGYESRFDLEVLSNRRLGRLPTEGLGGKTMGPASCSFKMMPAQPGLMKRYMVVDADTAAYFI